MTFKDGIAMDEKELDMDLSPRGTSDGRRDLQDMAEHGKKQQFERNFGFLSMLGFATTMMCTWEAVLFSNSTAMLNGGSVSLIYGFILCWIGTLATASSLAELSSIAPISGGQYHWVAMLAPDNSRRFLSWITGFIATIGWNANTAAGVYFAGTMVQGLLVLNYPTYNFERWQGTLLMFAALAIVLTVNTVAARLLPKIEGFILILHSLGFFAILIPMVYFSDRNSAEYVFTDFVNLSGWESGGLSFFVGLLSTNLPFIGYDGPCHMAEEVKNASVTVPRTILCTILLNGTLGFAMCIAFSFCTTDLNAALESTTAYDFIYVFFAGNKSLVGTSMMTSILIALVTSASFGFLATTSRQTWAFARDRGLPFSDWLVYMSRDRGLPLRAVGVCSIITALICVINVGSSVAFNAIVSVTIAGLFTSYLIPIVLIAWRRSSHHTVRWGPWSLGRWGLPINCFSIVFLTISIVFSFFPPALPVTAVSMNWSCLVFGGVMLIGLAYYAIIGRKVWQGPIYERDVRPTFMEPSGELHR